LIARAATCRLWRLSLQSTTGKEPDRVPSAYIDPGFGWGLFVSRVKPGNVG
jgi:hypothetical protein